MKKYLKRGVGLIGVSAISGAIPNLSGTAGEATIKSKFSEGLGNIGSTLPLQGKIIGTAMVVKSVKKLKPIKFKGAQKL